VVLPTLAAPTGTDLVVFVPIPNNDKGGAGVLLTTSTVDLSPYGDVQALQTGSARGLRRQPDVRISLAWPGMIDP
jgi:hypothetical protein